MTRRRLGIPTVLCTLVCVAALALWIRSAFREDRIGFTVSNRRICLGSSSHRMWIAISLSLDESAPLHARVATHEVEPFQGRHLLPSLDKPLLSRRLWLPYWLIVFPAALLPLRAIFRRVPKFPRRRASRRRFK